MADPVLEALWKKVLDNWEEDAAHGAFLEHCQSTQQLVEAAVRYRGMKGDRERGEVAEKRLKGVAILAMASLETTRSEKPRRTNRYTGIALIILFVIGSILLLNVISRT